MLLFDVFVIHFCLLIFFFHHLHPGPLGSGVFPMTTATAGSAHSEDGEDEDCQPFFPPFYPPFPPFIDLMQLGGMMHRGRGVPGMPTILVT